MAAICPLFYLPQNGGHRKCQIPLARSLSAGQFSGYGGCPPTSGVLFVQKDTACPVLSRLRYEH